MDGSQLDCSDVKDTIPLIEGESIGINAQATSHPMRTDFEDELAEKLPKKNGELNIGVGGVENTNGRFSGFKRARTTDDHLPSVHIIYKSLSRESKRKLEELLHQWSEGHAQQCSSKVSKEDLESGEETYLPALHVGPDKSSCTVSFYMDGQVKKKQRNETISFDSDTVPLYDCDYAFATSGDGLTNKESGLGTLNASCCFNCGSYDHSLKECQKPCDNIAISNARKLHQSNRNRTAGPRVPIRYYQNSPGWKFDGLNQGSLDAETRKLLGLAEFDPPPWLNRMREMRYPPGYLDFEDENQPSGITIFDDGNNKEEIFKLDVSEPRKKMSVAFPGINAPIPENVIQSCWAASHNPTNFNSYAPPLNYRSNCSPVINSEGHSNYSRWWPGYNTPESNPRMSNFARSYQHLNPNYINHCHSPYKFSPHSFPN